MKTSPFLCLALIAVGSSCAGRYEFLQYESELYRAHTQTGQLWRARVSSPIGQDQNGLKIYPEGFPKVKWEPVEEVATLQALEATAGERYPELQKTLQHDIRAGYMTRADTDEILGQREEFERRRSEIEAKYPGKVVVVADGTVYVGDTFAEALNQVPEGRLSYMEEIPLRSQQPAEKGKKEEYESRQRRR